MIFRRANYVDVVRMMERNAPWWPRAFHFVVKDSPNKIVIRTNRTPVLPRDQSCIFITVKDERLLKASSVPPKDWYHALHARAVMTSSYRLTQDDRYVVGHVK